MTEETKTETKKQEGLTTKEINAVKRPLQHWKCLIEPRGSQTGVPGFVIYLDRQEESKNLPDGFVPPFMGESAHFPTREAAVAALAEYEIVAGEPIEVK